jgi:hypothetical protein
MGTFAADQINLGNGFFEIVPVADPGTSVTAVPELGTWATGLLVVAALGYRQRQGFLSKVGARKRVA